MEESLRSQYRIHHSTYEQPIKKTDLLVIKTEPSSAVNDKNKPSVSEWMKKHPGKGINDYYSQFGV